jgi:putative ABC transport system permease protein
LQRIKDMPAVAWTIPIQLGDSFDGFPVMGTAVDFFKHYQSSGKALSFHVGHAFQDPHVNPEALMQVVVGSEVAQAKKLKLNDTMALTHGYQAIEETVHAEHPFKLVGILKPTGTPLDRSVLISLEAFEALHVGWGFGLRPSAFDAKPELPKDLPNIAELQPTELTAVWVGLHSRAAVFSARKAIESLKPNAASVPLMAVLPGAQLLIFVFQDHLLLSYGIQTQNTLPGFEAWYSIAYLMCAALVASLLPAWRAYCMSLSDGLNPPN